MKLITLSLNKNSPNTRGTCIRGHEIKRKQIHLMYSAEFSSILFYFLHFLQNRKKDNSTPEAHRKRANSYVNFEGMPMQVSEISSIGIFCPKFVLYGRKHLGLGGSNHSEVWPQVFKG